MSCIPLESHAQTSSAGRVYGSGSWFGAAALEESTCRSESLVSEVVIVLFSQLSIDHSRRNVKGARW